jgi:hypothetical protein
MRPRAESPANHFGRVLSRSLDRLKRQTRRSTRERPVLMGFFALLRTGVQRCPRCLCAGGVFHAECSLAFPRVAGSPCAPFASGFALDALRVRFRECPKRENVHGPTTFAALLEQSSTSLYNLPNVQICSNRAPFRILFTISSLQS